VCYVPAGLLRETLPEEDNGGFGAFIAPAIENASSHRRATQIDHERRDLIMKEWNCRRTPDSRCGPDAGPATPKGAGSNRLLAGPRPFLGTRRGNG
jgi:hypothetical protein